MAKDTKNMLSNIIVFVCPKLTILQKNCPNFENFAKNLSSNFLLFFSVFFALVVNCSVYII